MLPLNALDKLPPFFDTFKDVQSENSIFSPEIRKQWDEVHWYECGWYSDCPPNKTPHSELELRDRLEPTFVFSILDQNLPYTKPTRGKRKKITQVCTHSKENDIMSGEPFTKKRRVLQPATSSYTNHVIPSMLEPFFSIRIKTKVPKLTACNSNQISFELILNDSFLNILNVKEQTKTWPQFFYDINTFFTKVFFSSFF